jgi:hypothetical protein
MYIPPAVFITWATLTGAVIGWGIGHLLMGT